MAPTAAGEREELVRLCSSKNWSKAIRVLDSLLARSSSIQDLWCADLIPFAFHWLLEFLILGTDAVLVVLLVLLVIGRFAIVVWNYISMWLRTVIRRSSSILVAFRLTSLKVCFILLFFFRFGSWFCELCCFIGSVLWIGFCGLFGVYILMSSCFR